MQVLKNIITGLGIGFVCTVFSVVLFMGVNEITVQLLAWCVASAIYGVSATLFQIERIPRLYITIVHYLICLVTTLTVLLRVIETPVAYLFGIWGYFTAMYAVIYIVCALIAKKQVQEINEHLRAKKEQ